MSNYFETDEEILGNLPNEIQKPKHTHRVPKPPKEYEMQVLGLEAEDIFKNWDNEVIKVQTYRRKTKKIKRVPRMWWGWMIKVWQWVKRKCEKHEDN